MAVSSAEAKKKPDIRKYLRLDKLPHIWCAGCGNGIIIQALLRAIDATGWDQDEIAVVSGIGCSSRSVGYLDFNTLQTTHGRALAFATGLKLAKPGLRVIVLTGDGDCAAIGGNHFIHAARRNIDITTIVFNNSIYGMTGGQYSPMTPPGRFATTAPYGQVEQALDICKLAEAAGATYVARGTVYHATQLSSLILDALKHNGFSVVEVITPCPTGYGRRNKLGEAADMLRWQKDNAVPISVAKNQDPQTLAGKIVTGELLRREAPEFTAAYARIREVATSRVQPGRDEAPSEGGAACGEPGGVAGEAVKRMDRYEMRLSGSGGQGLVLGGIILAEAALLDGLNAVHSQSYGPEARGGASRSEVIVGWEEVDYPEVTVPDLVLAMTQESADKFAGDIKPGGLVIFDTYNVKRVPPVPEGARSVSIPITAIAKEILGREIGANVVALGVITGLTGVVSEKSMETAVLRRVPKGTEEANRKAFLAGLKAAKEAGVA